MERQLRSLLMQAVAGGLLIGLCNLIPVPEAAAQQRTRSDSTEEQTERSRARSSDRTTDPQADPQPTTAEQQEEQAARGRSGNTDHVARRPAPGDPETARGHYRRGDERRARTPDRSDRDDAWDDDRDGRGHDDARPRGQVRPVPPPVHQRPQHPEVQHYGSYYWAWVRRYRIGWTPLYSYRQRVYVEVGRRMLRMELRTYYRHRLRYATSTRAVVDMAIERIELYHNGRFHGEVNDVPAYLGRMRATVYRTGLVDFDRGLFLVGHPGVGFELISTPYYDRYILDAYERGHAVRAGVLDFYRRQVIPVWDSRLFDPHGYDGYAPIPLLPEDHDLLLDYDYPVAGSIYGDYAPRGRTGHQDHDYYSYDAYSERQQSSQRGDASHVPFRGARALQRKHEARHRTPQGTDIVIRREAAIERVE